MMKKRKWEQKASVVVILAATVSCTVQAAYGTRENVEIQGISVVQETETESEVQQETEAQRVWYTWDEPEAGMEQRVELPGTLAEKTAVWRARMESKDAERETEGEQQEIQTEKNEYISDLQLNEYTKIKDDSYRPMEQGYYGYFPIRYRKNGTMMSTAIPALVKDGHTYLNAEDICQRVGMEYMADPWSDAFQVQIGQREVIFWKDSAEVNIQMGPFLMEYTMPMATVYQDDTLWVGAEWFFWMLGGTFFPLPDGYVVVGAPKESALDVLTELYVDADAFDYSSGFGISSEGLKELDEALRRLDVYDGILNFELDKWAAVTTRYPSGAFIPDSSMYELITDSSYGADFMKLLLDIAPDEAYSIAETSEDIGKWAVDKYLDYTENFYKTYSQNLENMATVAEQYASIASNEGNFEFSQALGRYSNKKICESIDAAAKSDAYNALGKGAKAFSMLKDVIDCWNDYSNRDTYAIEGASTVMDSMNMDKKLGLTELSSGVIQSMNNTLDTYRLDQTGFTFTRWFTENIGSYAGDVLTGMMQIVGIPIELYQLGSRLIPSYVSALKEAEAFEMSLIGILYQSPAYTACKTKIDSCFQRKTPQFSIRDTDKPFEITFNGDALDEAVAQAYHYVKTRYVTRELALVTLQTHADNPIYQEQAALQEREMERIEALTSYCKEDLPLPSQWDEKSAGYDDSYLQALVTPAYLHVTGSFVDGQTKQEVSGVSVRVQDKEEKMMMEFVSKDDGTFDFYIPLHWRSESAQQLQKTLDTSGEFIPWIDPYKRSFAYPKLQEEAPLIWDGDHPAYPEFTKKFSELEMTELEGQGPSRELKLDTDKIVLGIDYYRFIRDELLPKMGFVNMGPAQKIITTDSYEPNWDQRKGLLGADIADLNQDGVEDLLVYYISEDDEYGQFSNGTYSKALYAELYSVTKEGEIVRIATRKLYNFNDISYTSVKLGLMRLDDTVFLYVEEDGYAYLANGGSVAYTWYGWDEKGALRPRWMIGHTDGGSSGLASSLLDYYDEDHYDKYVLCADGEFRYQYPDVEVLTEKEDNYAYDTEWALRAGFAMLRLNAVGVYQGSPNTYFTQNGRLPTCWGTELMKESVSYSCVGTRQEQESSSGTRYTTAWEMNTSLEDRTGLREKIEQISSNEN